MSVPVNEKHGWLPMHARRPPEWASPSIDRAKKRARSKRSTGSPLHSPRLIAMAFIIYFCYVLFLFSILCCIDPSVPARTTRRVHFETLCLSLPRYYVLVCCTCIINTKVWLGTEKYKILWFVNLRTIKETRARKQMVVFWNP